jgi:hypothetical protein
MRPATEREPSTVGTLVFLMWGLIVWGLQFTATYVAHTLFCALGAPASATDILAAGLTVVAVVLILPLLLAPARTGRFAGLRGEPDHAHLLTIARVIALLSAVAVVWTGVTAAFVEACALAR